MLRNVGNYQLFIIYISLCNVHTSYSILFYNLGMGAVDSFALDFEIIFSFSASNLASFGGWQSSAVIFPVLSSVVTLLEHFLSGAHWPSG